MPTELWIGILTGGFALLGLAVGGLITFVASSTHRKAAVRDQAYAQAVTACAEYAGASHILISRDRDVITSLAHASTSPDPASPRNVLAGDHVKTLVHPMIEQYYRACLLAEALAPTSTVAQLIESIDKTHVRMAALTLAGGRGQLPEDWDRQADQIVRDHDDASAQLTRHLREVGASTTYRLSRRNAKAR